MPPPSCSAELRLVAAVAALALACLPLPASGSPGEPPGAPLGLRPSEDPAAPVSPPTASSGMALQLAVVLNGRDTGAAGSS
ncbi:hypothetical protein WDZ92_47890, partial [Nostoc sp. NIES-2111]